MKVKAHIMKAVWAVSSHISKSVNNYNFQIYDSVGLVCVLYIRCHFYKVASGFIWEIRDFWSELLPCVNFNQ